MFKDQFKYFKQKSPPPDLDDVLDFRIEESFIGKVIEKEPFQSSRSCDKNLLAFFKPTKEWKIYEVIGRPGLLFISNPWTALGQRYWIARCLLNYTKKPNKLNLDIHSELTTAELENWWISANQDEYQFGGEKGLMKKLRWATLGYHHNWDTKRYSENNKSEFPQDLLLISRYVAEIAGHWIDYNAQAAIINFYHPDCTLSGHKDQSERNMDAPLLSFSFGLSAIFLIGGKKLEDEATPIFVDSGDIIIMSSEARLSYHAVPRIMSSESRKLPDDCYDDISLCKSINLTNVDFNLELLASIQYDNGENNWTYFKNYIKNSRINMNIRQVLFSFENKLPEVYLLYFLQSSNFLKIISVSVCIIKLLSALLNVFLLLIGLYL